MSNERYHGAANPITLEKFPAVNNPDAEILLAEEKDEAFFPEDFPEADSDEVNYVPFAHSLRRGVLKEIHEENVFRKQTEIRTEEQKRHIENQEREKINKELGVFYDEIEAEEAIGHPRKIAEIKARLVSKPKTPQNPVYSVDQHTLRQKSRPEPEKPYVPEVKFPHRVFVSGSEGTEEYVRKPITERPFDLENYLRKSKGWHPRNVTSKLRSIFERYMPKYSKEKR